MTYDQMSDNDSLSCTNSLVTTMVVINIRNIPRGPKCLHQCKAVHRCITDVCRSFSDILPIKETRLPEGSTDSDSTQLTFAGEKDNPSRVDQLALLLLDILRDGHIHAAKHGRSMHCKYSSSVLQGKNNFDPLSYDSTYVTLSF